MNTIDAKLLQELFIAGAARLEENKEYVNELNVFPVPDGDTGTNMTMTIQSAVREVEAIDEITMASVCKAISSGSLRGARGNSGVILSQLLRGMTRQIKEYDEIDINLFAAAFDKAAQTAYKAVMKPKEGTILTVAKGGAEAACYLADKNLDMISYFENIVRYMREVLALTPEMLPVLKEAGVVDSGGEGLLIIIEGALECLKNKGFEGGGVVIELSGMNSGHIKKPVVSESLKTASKPSHNDRPQPHVSVKPIAKADAVRPVPKSKADISTSDIKFGYCTEFIIMLEYEFDDKAEAEFKVFLEAIGDSIVVVADDDIVKVHVHTNMPGIAIQKALTYGSLTSMKIDNMREEHNERLMLDAKKAETEQEDAVKEDNGDANSITETALEETVSDEPALEGGAPKELKTEEVGLDETIAEDLMDEAASEEKVQEESELEEPEFEDTDVSDSELESEDVDMTESQPQDVVAAETEISHANEFGFIAVSAGEGLSKIFAGLGADIVIEGGQTMNPSTEDILNAIDQIDANNIFVLPNNSNIILAAQQARSLIEDKNIVVIPSKTVPQGIMAMLSYMPNMTVEENEAAMLDSMSYVKSGSVTYSIRDTVIQNIEIKQGDIMGIGDTGIMNTGSQVMSTTVELVNNLLDENSELVTLYYGKDTTEDEANLIADMVNKKHPELDVEVHYGGQPVYYYFVSVE